VSKAKKPPNTVKQLARMGGYARAKKYTAKERSDSARLAAIARWNAYRAAQEAEEQGTRRAGERW